MADDSSKLSVEEIDRTMVVSFVDKRFIGDSLIRQVGQELSALVDDSGPSRIYALDFAQVEFLNSDMIGCLFAFTKKVWATDGKVVLFNTPPHIHEVFKITGLNRALSIVNTREVALGVLQSPGLEFPCPVASCGSWIHSTRVTGGKPSPMPIWKETCAACRSQIILRPSLRAQEQAQLLGIIFPTYKNDRNEAIHLRAADCCWLVVKGRLNLFTSKAFRRAWQTVPAPRRVVIDLRNATELTPPGVEALVKLCSRTEDDSRTVILIDPQKTEAAGRLSGLSLAYSTESDAITALGEIPADARRPITVPIRSRIGRFF